jgi:hypothetical protein
MGEFRGFDNQNNDAGMAGLLAGLLAGVGTYLGSEWAWWKAGFGPWTWDRPEGKPDTIHSYFLYAVHPIFPAHVSDLSDRRLGSATWSEFRNRLIYNHINDSFFSSFWVPLTLGILAGLATAWIVVRAINRQRKSYLRGSRIH